MRICKFPKNIPSTPNIVYKDKGWISFPDFLGYENKTRTIEEWVIVAKRLAKENGGILPGANSLIRNGHSGLYVCMKKNPEPFSDIERDKSWMNKNLEERVALAEDLADKNGGLFPTATEIVEMGYKWLYSYMIKYPEPFKHIKRDSRNKTIEEHVVDAESIAKENGGILPKISDLKKMGHEALIGWMYKKPERFSHIEKHKTRKSKKEQVAIAEELAKNNGGILQNVAWLMNNGHSGIPPCMRKSPKLFEHIPQHRRGNKKYKSRHNQ